MIPSSEVTIGLHRVAHETEDIIGLYFGCAPTDSEMRSILNAQAEFSAGKPYYLVIDLSRVATMPASARRIIGEAATRLNWQGVAMYGASFHVRVVASLINNALGIFRKATLPQDFFETREAALAWLEGLRNQRTGGA